MYNLLRLIPKNLLSFLVGQLVHLKLPGPLSPLAVRIFCRLYQINVDEASKELHSYPSIGDFFVRDLKPGIRPLGAGVCSPVDGRLRNFGVIENGLILQVKGKSYSLKSLLQDTEESQSFLEGMYFHFYLSPQDYHHVHLPCDAKIGRAVYIPGKLWPVNDWSLHSIDDLYAVNERVVSYLDTELGRLALVMVGATNVGRIEMVYDAFDCASFARLSPGRRCTVKEYEPPTFLTKGERLGTFRMGSSVVLLLPRGMYHSTAQTQELLKKKIKFGESLHLAGGEVDR